MENTFDMHQWRAKHLTKVINESVKVEVRYSTEFGSSSSIIDVTEIPKFSKRFNIISVNPVEDSYDEEESSNDYSSGPR